MSTVIRATVAVALMFAVAATVSQSALAATKHHHHSMKATGHTSKPAEQYMRSASPPDPEHAQR
jgi:hypothetical protein